MSKAHKAILDSLRQKPPRQPRGVQTKGIRSFEVCDDLLLRWQPAVPAVRSWHSLPALLPKANCSWTDAGRPYAHLYPITPLSLRGEVFVPRERESWRIARVFSRSHLNNPGSVSRAGRAVPPQHHPQPDTVLWDVDRYLAPGCRLGSQPN